jgi:hypothetical protein
MVVSHTDFLNYYPNNTPTDFRIHTPRMNLKGNWYVGVCETNISVDRNCDLFIFLDICGDTLVKGEKKPYLRNLSLQAGDNDVEFKHIMYIPIVTNDFHSLRFSLEAQSPISKAQFILHFKRYPFF